MMKIVLGVTIVSSSGVENLFNTKHEFIGKGVDFAQSDSDI